MFPPPSSSNDLRAARSWRGLQVGWAHGVDRAKRPAGSLLVVLPLLVTSACDKSRHEERAAAPSASRGPTKKPPLRAKELKCSEVEPGARYLFGEVGRNPASGDDGEAIDLPFAVEVGTAVPTQSGFAVAALKGDRALVALVSDDGGRGREVELDEIHGDVEPPKLASRGGTLIAAIAGSDAGGTTLTLASIEPASEPPAVSHGAPISRERGGPSAFDLALGTGRGLLVWDRWNKSRARGSIAALRFEPGNLEGTQLPELSLPDDDAEEPQVVVRPGGYWLTWVSHGAPAPAPAKAEQANGTHDAAPDSPEGLVDSTPRRLKLMPLDENGGPAAEARLVTAEESHVLAYDLVSLGDSALLAWRDDPTTLGAEAPAVHWARVSADGHVSAELLEDDKLAAGAPRLFAGRAAGAEPSAFLVLMGKGGHPRLGYFDSAGALAGGLRDVSGFGLNEPLALNGARFLLAKPKGRALDLSVTRCALQVAR